MEQIQCIYCGDFSHTSPRHKNQKACKKAICQRAKKAEWHRHMMKIDPDYNSSQKISRNSGSKRILTIGNNNARRILKKPNVIASFNPPETENRIRLQRWTR